jgi:signal transduction histidine kinase
MLVDDVFELLAQDGSSRIELRNEVPPDLEVVADAEQLFRVILNLGRNAAQAITRSGEEQPSRVDRITVSARREGGEVHVRVADTGPGFGEKQREQLFRAFADAAPGGTGLGLSIAAELVRAHGGRIELEESSDMGATFLFVLPDVHSRPKNGKAGKQAAGSAN